MHLLKYPPDALTTLARLNQVHLNGITISQISPKLGLGVLFHPDKYNPKHHSLITIDKELILSLESVELAGKSDVLLREVLRACCGILGANLEEGYGVKHEEAGVLGFDLMDEDEDEEDEIHPWGRNPRLMIMLFLAIMLARGEFENEGNVLGRGQRRAGARVGSGGIWSVYIKFLSDVSLPTMWTEAECALLRGTSLDPAVSLKKSALRREFHTFQKLTASIPWCKQYLWEPSSPAEGFTLSNWVQIDSWLRSRSLELPGLGICLIPFLDMVNHSDDANAYYSLDDDGNVVLLPIEANDGETLLSRDTEDSTEIRINYGAYKSSAEFLFTYGFLNASPCPPTCLWLSIPLPMFPTDPLTLAKKIFLGSPPTLKLIDVSSSSIEWLSPSIWLLVTNAEDGLQFTACQETTGAQELRLYWHPMRGGGDEGDDQGTCEEGVLINDLDSLKVCLEESKLWEVYYLRAVVTFHSAVLERLRTMDEDEEVASTIEESARLASVEGESGNVEHSDQVEVRKDLVLLATDLRGRERRLLKKSAIWFVEEQERLARSEVVQAYLSKQVQGEAEGNILTSDVNS